MDPIASKLHALIEFCLYGVKIVLLPFNTGDVINVFKGLTLFVMLFLQWKFANYTAKAVVYVACHGAYGLIWVLKDRLVPDLSWKRQTNLLGSFVTATVLCLYWYIGFLVLSNPNEASMSKVVVSVMLHNVGVALMIGADVQKNVTLQMKKGLITSGFFSLTRNPNYLGEIMLYSAYGILSGHFHSWIILCSIWFGMFRSNMCVKGML